ncbi:MAG: beta-ketoacyl-ACP reductase [SAR324 cluster bacterium]|uniref:Beta-ketoacyl-ACP reductase n=1 Tax=SAR324 cluster bacterium TaxID=2024889 RepID=A0A2A4T8V8_9DELT|nr:MAG: beta-ketoacyl-ACP reductase [SAR324 cluster bacterium]
MKKHTVLVTGGTGGIGKAICMALSDEGFSVVASCSGNSCKKMDIWQEEMKMQGYSIPLVRGDVADFDSCTKMVQDAEQLIGSIDILVNVAGITRDGSFRKMSTTQWQNVIRTNLDSVYNVTQQVINGMIERRFGRIINISSVNGQKGQFGQTNYSAAKAGMHGFTMALAQEVAHKGITVNTVSPGYIATEMVMAVDEDIRKEIVKQIPVGRFGEPEEIARVVSFLADEQSGFITGADMSINGGMYMH